MNVKVLVNGAAGKMGQPTVRALRSSADFTLVGELGRADDLASAITSSGAEVVVDFTHAGVVADNLAIIIEAGARPVIGTSGLTDKALAQFRDLCNRLKRGAIIAPNFSLGAVLLMRYAAAIARYLPEVEIIEYHHQQKLDAPSATALKTAAMIAAARQTSPQAMRDHETIPGARGARYQDIPIHAVRLPGLVAHQTVLFGGDAETLTLRHDSLSRECFMPGVLLACRRVMTLNQLVYGLENLLDDDAPGPL